MSLKHAILVLLETQPGSGYDLVKQFKQSLGYFWNASHQQVYLQLKKLADESLIEFTIESQSDRPDRKVYQITETGKADLIAWLSSDVKPNKINDALLVKLYGGHLLTPQQIIDELDRHIGIHTEVLNNLRKIEGQYRDLPEAERGRLKLPFLTLRRGIIGEEAWLVWAEEVRHELA